jgi:class 3 adenylate cyclase/tetratricopeptide (TPR) repeat protein
MLADSASQPGEVVAAEAAVLFADISGFTPMAEALALAGRQGAEEMTQHLNATFSATIDRITAYGGEVAAFGGDAILSFFPRQDLESLEVAAWRALTCALELHQVVEPLAHIDTSVGPFSLNLKFGLSAGRIVIVGVGAPDHGMEFVIAGTPVDRAAGNENLARSGQVVADATVLDRVGPRAQLEPIPRSDDPIVSRVLSVEPAPVLDRAPERTIDYASMSEAQRQALLEAVAVYLPRPLYKDLVSKGRFSGDHRPVTSLFVNFGGLDYDRDPRVGEKLHAYVVRAQEIIHRYDGNLNRLLTGDKGSLIHVLFGAPVAHEDDKARALRCALALRQELSQLPFIDTQRMGLASGYVFAGPVGAVERQQYAVTGGWLPVTRGEYTVMGDIVNLSARLMGVCPPGQILVDPYTRSRTAQRFRFLSFGPVRLKGKSEAIAPYQLEEERPAENLLVTRYLSSRRSLVGRQKELKAVQAVVDAALEGRGQVLAMTGPAGIGKSRLVEEAVRRWLQADGVGYAGDCISHGSEIPYQPWVDLWQAQFDLYEHDDPEARQAKITRFGQALDVDLSEWMVLVAGRLGLPLQDQIPSSLAPLDAQARQQRLMALTTELLTAQARRQPVLLLLDDLHWADHASLALIDHIARHIADLPVLICIAYRPRAGVELACQQQPFYHALDLEEMSEQEATALIESMLGDVDLPPDFVQAINAKAQGNPLFVEELVNGLIDGGTLVREKGGYRVAGDLDRFKVPDTVEAVLLARIDQLAPPNRDLLRVAAVIGRQFDYAVLRGVYPYPMSEAEMQDRLIRLEELGLTRLERPEPELEYLIKHALTQEVAYSNLSFALRRDLHQRIGQFLELHYKDHLETFYGTLARHFAQGGQPARALPYALSAGVQAQALYANDEALAYYRQAESVLEQLTSQDRAGDDGRSFEKERLRLFLNRGELYTLLGHFEAAETDLTRGLSLAQEMQDHQAEAQALNGLAYLRWWQTRHEDMLNLARQAQALAEAGDHFPQMMIALRHAGTALEELEQHDAALDFFQRARLLAEALDDAHALSVVNMNIAVAAVNQGRYESALEAFEALLDIYRKSGDKHRASDCLTNIANTLYYLGDFEVAESTYRESIALERAIGKQAGLAYSLCDFGTLLCHRAQYAAGRAAMEEAREIFTQLGEEAGRAYCELALGREYFLEGLDAGDGDRARVLLEGALPVLEAAEAYEQVAEAWLALCRWHLERGETQMAQTYVDQGLALCRKLELGWRLPEALLRRSELALAQGDKETARDFAWQTLDAVETGGCPDYAPLAHLLLARLVEDPRQHYRAAVTAARQRSRRRDLTRVLREAKGYLEDTEDAQT